MAMKRYKFKPILGPAHGKPLGSFERAECFGNELECTVEQIAYAVEHLARLIKRILADDPPPLTVFLDPPCESLNEYLWICSGKSEDQLAAVLHAFGHHDLCDTGC